MGLLGTTIFLDPLLLDYRKQAAFSLRELLEFQGADLNSC